SITVALVIPSGQATTLLVAKSPLRAMKTLVALVSAMNPLMSSMKRVICAGVVRFDLGQDRVQQICMMDPRIEHFRRRMPPASIRAEAPCGDHGSIGAAAIAGVWSTRYRSGLVPDRQRNRQCGTRAVVERVRRALPPTWGTACRWVRTSNTL